MKQFATKPLSLLGLFALAACAPARTAPAPAPAPTKPLPAAVTPAAPAAPREAPREWQLLDDSLDHVPGIGAQRAERQLLAGKQPRRTVVVAVIDGGVDTAHADLKASLWRNPKEVAGNGKDDDGNGYADDIYGWNFIGGRDGRDVQYDTHEVTRLYLRCMTAGQRASTDTLLSPERCKKIEADFDKKKGEAQQLAGQVDMADAAMSRATQILKEAMHTDSLTVERVTAFKPGNSQQQEAKRIFTQLSALGITPKAIAEAKEDVASRLQYGFNITYDPRPIVGDDPTNLSERRYGNRDVMGPDAKHGTHVSGIIGAVRGNGVGVDGIAPAVRIMMVRAVPDGDERDKDIANAIRYAVDNGAQIINMSFGKAYSPQKQAVDEAVKYADARGVLMIHAAGNDGENVDTTASFPTAYYLNGGRAANWIEVGATSWKGADSLVASFSNYGQKRVDVFAPGVDILSTVPGGGYERESGTSMAAPVVTGLAALLMGYFPDLGAADVKRIILASATRHADQQVLRPGDQESGPAAGGGRVSFGSLSATGGIVNAYAAVKMAQEGK